MRYVPGAAPAKRDPDSRGRLNPDHMSGGDTDIVWTGAVVPDPSIAECLGGAATGDKTHTIRDVTYRTDDNMQFDNRGRSRTFPNEVTLVCRGTDGTRPARCSAFVSYGRPRRGLLRGSGREVAAKGFVLEPLHDGALEADARLALFRFDNSASDNEVAYGLDSIVARPSLSLEGLGLAAFASGSRGSDITLARDPKRSVTIVFVASDRNPFASVLRTKRGTRRVACGGGGFSTTSVADSPAGTAAGEPLQILKTRLARGEITMEEYERLRRAVE